jgi:hypothetical protein
MRRGKEYVLATSSQLLPKTKLRLSGFHAFGQSLTPVFNVSFDECMTSTYWDLVGIP